MGNEMFDLLEQINSIPDTEDGRMKAVAIRKMLVSDVKGRVAVVEMAEGSFEKVLPLELANEAKNLFTIVAEENNLTRTTDKMFLYVYILYWIQFNVLTKDFFKIYKRGEDLSLEKITFLNAVKKIQSVSANFMIQFQKELSISRDKRMVKKLMGVDSNENAWSVILSNMPPPDE